MTPKPPPMHATSALHVGAQDDQSSDAGLIRLAQGGDAHAAGVLLDRYGGLAGALSRSFYIIGGDSEDVLQGAMIGLFTAVMSYHADAPDLGPFPPFAALCIRRRLYSAVKSSLRLKHRPLNAAMRLDGDPDWLEALQGISVADPAELLDSVESTGALVRMLSAKLTHLERTALAFVVQGWSYTEIASHLGRTPKSIDNAVRRARAKCSRCVADAEQELRSV